MEIAGGSPRFIVGPSRDANRTLPPRWRVADGVGREVLQRLLEAIRSPDTVSAPGSIRDAHGDAGVLTGALVPRRHAIEQLRDRHLLDPQCAAPAFEARKIQQSPISRSSRLVSSLMIVR